MSKASETRMMILHKSFELIYLKGYQATSIDEIIATTQVTKGAFFYHFKNKEEMGVSLINEVLYPGMYKMMVKPLEASDNPAQEIYHMIENLLLDENRFNVNYGCPAVNLIDEMAPINDGFKKALSKLFIQWQNAIVALLERGKSNKKISSSCNSEEVAVQVLAGYSGVRNVGKIMGKASYQTYLNWLKIYLSIL